MKTNNQKTLRFRINPKILYLAMLFAVVSAAGAAFLQTATFESVSAQEKTSNESNTVRATPEMIAYALTHETENLAVRFNIMNQLPCVDLEDSELGGKSLRAGVYCLPAARLTGELILDAENDPGSVFIFLVKGKLNTEAGSRVSLINDAQAANIHFLADSVEVGTETSFKGNILSGKAVSVGSGSTIKGRVQSVNNSDSAREFDAPEGIGTGTLEICKSLDASTTDISNRIFNFTVTGVIGTVGTAANPLRVPAGACSTPIEVAAGQQLITELNSGTFTNQGGTFAGGFQLNRVETITTNSQSTLGVVNRATRQATVNIVEGTAQQELTLRFVNQFAITGFVEICKRAALVPIAGTPADPDVTGFFTFTIEGVFTQNQQNPNVRTLQQFPVPVGQCTNAIAVTISNPLPTTNGGVRESSVRVTEFGRTGMFLESVNTIPADRLLGDANLNSGIDSAGNTFSNAGGGYATVRILEGASPFNETIINFVNRSNPGIVKVCKIAGPGIPLNTPFNFTVSGLAQAGTQPNGFAQVSRDVTVLAGPADQGSCQFVPAADGGIQGFVVGSPVLVVETGPMTINNFQVRTSRVRSSTGEFAPVDFPNGNPNPDLEPTGDRISRAAITARNEVIMFEFTNFVFRPATLKICKIAASPALLNQPFTFDIALVSPIGIAGNLFPAASASVTVNAGAASDGGNCAIVDGSNFLGGSLNANSTVTITERAATGSAVTAITSSTSPNSTTNGISTNPGTRTATLAGVNGLRGDVTINIVTFTNTAVAPPARLARLFDFDGDGKADLSTFTAASGNWTILGSSDGLSDMQFGISTDKIVPQDYDGDGKTDIAVYRGGVWFIQQSRDGFKAVQFGEADDVPQPGDFDGDGRADAAIFRPSTGIWYWLGSTGGFDGVQFGSATDQPLTGDYDGDGKADQAVFRAATGSWYINRSTAGFTGIQFGIQTDKPVPADYDGDGKTDVAVYREGNWYIQGSSEGFKTAQFGSATDRAVPADYDGDGKADIGVYRNGIWYITDSGTVDAQLKAVQFGGADDIPVPASFQK